MKTNPGRFFEDYRLGEVIRHAVPRSVSGGERALYHALYPARHALYSSNEFARASGLPDSPIDDLAAFHIVFGKSVPDISLNAVANLGYAEARWLRPVYPGDTLRAESEVIGLKQNSSGKTGVVALDGTTGDTRWTESTPAVTAGPVAHPEGVVVQSHQLVTAFGLDGTRRWSFNVPEETARLLAVDERHVYVSGLRLIKAGSIRKRHRKKKIQTCSK